MGTTRDVKDRIPGLQFRLSSKTRKSTPTVAGTFHGLIELACEFRDIKMFEAAAEKLDGFKIFSDLSEEMVDALGEELDNTEQTLAQSRQENEELKAILVEKDAEITRLQGLLQVIEDDVEDRIHEAAQHKRRREAGG